MCISVAMGIQNSFSDQDNLKVETFVAFFVQLYFSWYLCCFLCIELSLINANSLCLYYVVCISV